MCGGQRSAPAPRRLRHTAASPRGASVRQQWPAAPACVATVFRGWGFTQHPCISPPLLVCEWPNRFRAYQHHPLHSFTSPPPPLPRLCVARQPLDGEDVADERLGVGPAHRRKQFALGMQEADQRLCVFSFAGLQRGEGTSRKMQHTIRRNVHIFAVQIPLWMEAGLMAWYGCNHATPGVSYATPPVCGPCKHGACAMQLVVRIPTLVTRFNQEASKSS